MKGNYFKVDLDFDKDNVDNIIQTAIKNKTKGYVCSIESNNLTVANKNPEFLKVVNHALVNICDGSVIAWLIGKIHHQPFLPYIGADFFIKYIKMCKYKQLFLGNTIEILDGLKDNLSEVDPSIKEMSFNDLPFKKVDDFDYQNIAKMINTIKPDIIWISLGAPKQEIFMNKLLPYLDSGIMFGFGAIFNFYSNVGKVKRAPLWMRNCKLEWLFRAYQDPKKNVPRYWAFIKLLPSLIYREYKIKKITLRN